MNFQRTNTKISLLEDYYNHFDEDHRLDTRHGHVEYVITMKYIHDVLNNDKKKKILDIGAGTGKYSVALHKEGYDVTAVELVPHNIEEFKKKDDSIPLYQGNALDLSFLKTASYDVTLLFGPMYHLLSENEKIRALNEAKRVTKENGVLLVAYVMNEYALLSYGFLKGNILEAEKEGQVDETFHVVTKEGDLYSYLRLEDIDHLNEACNLERKKIIAADGPANLMRRELNAMDEQTYQEFVKYQLSVCERKDLLGASSHLVDIVKKRG